jgi:hypothetical protein
MEDEIKEIPVPESGQGEAPTTPACEPTDPPAAETASAQADGE